MRQSVLVSLLALGAQTVYSQGPWSQCGGDGYTGSKLCPANFYCFYTNQWYSQCIPGTASGSVTTRTTTAATSVKTSTTKTPVQVTTTKVTTKATTTTKASTTPATTASNACGAAFTATSAKVAYAALNPGWNLGNTLDAIPDEGSWNNPPAQLATLQQIRAKGFNSVRIPVTWTAHFDTQAPTYNVNAAWMNRVETVVDQALATGFWVVLNVHHDSWEWADVTKAGANIPEIEAKFARLWAQIAQRFKCKGVKLIFEAINEPVGDNETHGNALNRLNDIFLTEINKAGGNNPKRVVSLCGLGQDYLKTTKWFKRGNLFPNQPWGLQFHYYSPYDFIFDAWGRTVWGSDADKAVMTQEFTDFAGNFSGIPTFIGEWDASTLNTETNARWKYFDFFLRLTKQFGFSQIIWDNGLDQFDRTTNTWRDPVAVDILFNAVAGRNNALPDSTTDQAATSQSISAFLFHKVGTPVVAQSVSYKLNGNTLASVKNKAGTTLSSSQYTLASDGKFTLSAQYLSSVLSANAAAGIKETLTLDFNPGASLTLTIVQYNTPTAPKTTFSIGSLTGETTIPINYAGLPVIAAVKALKADGTYLAEDYTQYFGPLQQARWTQGQWFWNAGGFLLYQTGIDTIKAAGQTVTLTIEFYPRTLGQNSLTLTFNQ